MKRFAAILLLVCLTAAGCAGGRETEETPAPSETAAPSETPAPTPTPSPSPSPSPTPGPDQARTVAGSDYDYSQSVPETEAVEEGYFADAAFIGDSRIDGFRLYSGLTEGDFIVKTGMSIFKVAEDQLTYNGEKMTALEALGQKKYGKIYLSMGINELGMYNDQGYHDHYAAFIDSVRAQQPQATIYIQLLIPVNTQKCAEKGMADYINNERVAIYNDLLHQVAQEKQVFLVDPAEELTDETGEPPYDSVADGVHFKREPYQQWLDYLKRHTAERGEAA